MTIDGVMKDVIIEGSKPGYIKNTLIQVGMERGSAVGTAGVKIDIASDEDEYIGDESQELSISLWTIAVCITEKAGSTVHAQGARQRPSQTKEEPLGAYEALDALLTR
eukprot:2535657-Amphidinium_carterae.1